MFPTEYEYSGASRKKIAFVFQILILIPRGLGTFFSLFGLNGHPYEFGPSFAVGNPWIRLIL